MAIFKNKCIAKIFLKQRYGLKLLVTFKYV